MKCTINNHENISNEYQIVISCPYRESFCIVTNSFKINEYLWKKYGIYCSTSKGTLSKKCMLIRVYFCETEYSIITKDGVCTTKTPIRVLDNIMSHANPFSNDVYLFHGAAVSKNDKAVLFLAPTSIGKTTLTSYLTNYGFSYLTDDCIIIEKNTLFVVPYSTPMMLRSGGKKVLEFYNISTNDLDTIDNELEIRYVYTPKNFQNNKATISSIYFINRADLNSVSTLSSYDAKIKLLKSTMSNYELNQEYMNFITRLAKINCYDVSYNDITYISNLISKNGDLNE